MKVDCFIIINCGYICCLAFWYPLYSHFTFWVNLLQCSVFGGCIDIFIFVLNSFNYVVFVYMYFMLILFGQWLQGALDGGLDIPHSDKRFAGFSKDSKQLDAEIHRKYIYGGHVSSYMMVHLKYCFIIGKLNLMPIDSRNYYSRLFNWLSSPLNRLWWKTNQKSSNHISASILRTDSMQMASRNCTRKSMLPFVLTQLSRNLRNSNPRNIRGWWRNIFVVLF